MTRCCTPTATTFRVFELDELTMLIGPDQSAVLLEIGVAWQRIGDILGTSAQAAQQRYGSAVESA